MTIELPDLVTMQIRPELLDRWLKIGEDLDKIEGIKFAKFGPNYVLMVVLPDGTDTPIEWPEGTVTFMEAYRENESAEA